MPNAGEGHQCHKLGLRLVGRIEMMSESGGNRARDIVAAFVWKKRTFETVIGFMQSKKLVDIKVDIHSQALSGDSGKRNAAAPIRGGESQKKTRTTRRRRRTFEAAPIKSCYVSSSIFVRLFLLSSYLGHLLARGYICRARCNPEPAALKNEAITLDPTSTTPRQLLAAPATALV